MILPVKKMHSDKSCVLPHIFATQVVKAKIYANNECSNKFNLFQEQFGCLANQVDFNTLKTCCVQIDIQDELRCLKKDYALEVTVPVQGLVDVLGTSSFTKNKLSFSCPIQINGFGKKTQDKENSFPKADYVLITDIGGNQYEAFVNEDGKIELPSDGTGLFSLINSITFIFNEKQVKHGFGLEKLSSPDSKENKLYLLGPSDCNEDFVARVCVTHINGNHQRIVDTIRSVKIKYPNVTLRDYQSKTIVNRKTEEISDKLNINLAMLLLLPLAAHHPMTATVTLEPLKGVKYGFGHQGLISLSNENHGWVQHPVHTHVFTKHYGLSENTLNHLVRNIYSEYDLMKDYLKGDSFSLSHQNGYNNFLLIPEAIGNFYDRLNHDIIHHQISGSFLFDRIPEERLANIDFTHLPVDFHDSIVLNHIQSELSEHNYSQLKHLFLSDSHSKANEISDHFTVFANGLTTTPEVTVHISHGPAFVYDPNQDSVHTHLVHEQSQTVLHLHDIMDIQPMHHEHDNFLTHHGFDLAHMLEAQVAWTPLMTTSQEVGKEVAMTVTEDNGAPFNTTMHVQVQPLTEVEIDPSHIHTHF